MHLAYKFAKRRLNFGNNLLTNLKIGKEEIKELKYKKMTMPLATCI